MPRNIKIGDKFELLGMIWTVTALAFSKTTFHAETDTGESIWLDPSKNDKLEWIEEKPKLADEYKTMYEVQEAIRKSDVTRNQFKSEIIRETLAHLVDTIPNARYNDFMDWRDEFASAIRRKVQEI